MMSKINKLVETLEENGYGLTKNVFEAIFILPDGRMVDGGFDCGLRGEDHRMIAVAVPDEIDPWTPEFWEYVHMEFDVVQMVPESKIALIKPWQKTLLTTRQRHLLAESGYTIEEF